MAQYGALDALGVHGSAWEGVRGHGRVQEVVADNMEVHGRKREK